MAILDLFKEIPLSAVLKERLVDLEKKVSNLEMENQNLKALLAESEKQRRTLEEHNPEKLLEEKRLVERLNEENAKSFGF